MPITVWGQRFEHFDQAVSYVKSHSDYDDETARKIVGKAQAEQETQEHFNKSLKETTTMERGCLTKCKDIKEAMKVLDDAKVEQDDILRFVVGSAMRYTDEEEKKKALEMAETEMEKKETAAHGTEGSHQSSGSDLPPFPGKTGKEGDLSASKQPGGDQMGNATKVSETEEFDSGSCVARKIADGMSAEEARKACSGEKETHYRETVKSLRSEVKELTKLVRETVMPSITSLDKRIKETADAAKQKPGTMTFEKPIGDNGRPLSMTPTVGVRETTRAASSGQAISVDEMRKDILSYDNALNI